MKKETSYKKITAIIILGMVFVTAVTIGAVIHFGNNVFRFLEEDEKYDFSGKHYAFVCGNSQDGFYESIRQGAYEEAEKTGDYLESMGRNTALPWETDELMELSIDAGVDGIIVDAGESEEMRDLIDKAEEQGIPVITVARDNTSSARKSYVGFGYYDLGVNYGKELLKKASDDEKRVIILMSPDAEDSSQNIIYQGIRETIERSDASSSFKLETVAVPDTSAFGAEEKISAIIMGDGELPDVIICLNEIFTTCVCQALVDYNRVGETLVYGFYENNTILSSIQKNIIYATLTMDTRQMGRYCIEAMKEYENYGYVNEYMPVDITVVTAENIDEYMAEISGEEDEEDDTAV